MIERDVFTQPAVTTLPLDILARSPDCGNWLAAILLQSRRSRFPGWGLECALSTVDKQLRINSAHFLVQPPKSWKEDCNAEYPVGVTARRVEDEGLSPSRAFLLLNKIFGSSLVYLNGRMDRDERERLEAATGVKLTWETATHWDWLGKTLRLDLDEFSFATFYCNFSPDGTPLQRAELAARSYVNAARARQRMIGAVVDYSKEGERDLLGM